MKRALLMAAHDQLDSPETAYVRQHYERLLVGFQGVMERGAKFDEERYKERLKTLPDMSWIEEDGQTSPGRRRLQ